MLDKILLNMSSSENKDFIIIIITDFKMAKRKTALLEVAWYTISIYQVVISIDL